MGLFSQSKRKRIYDEITFTISATYASLTDEFI